MSIAQSPMRLLLVEDDPISRAFLADALGSLPAAVDVAGDIATAETMVARHRHALWLVDANLPDGSGEDCLRQLRRRHPDPVAICITADDDPGKRRSLLDGGFSDVLGKPIAVEVLLASVRRHAATQDPTGPGWSDAAALAALGGNRTSLATLRTMFLAELPAQQRGAAGAYDRGDHDALRAVLHLLKAGCGFVGADELSRTVRRWSEAPADARLRQEFDECVAMLLARQPGAG